MLKIKIGKSIVSFYYFSLFAILCGGLFSFLFKGTPLVSWRQMFTVIGFLIFLYYFKINERRFVSVRNKLLRVTYYCLPFCIVGLFFQNYSFLRVGFSFWVYVAGFHLVLFPYILAARENFKPKTLFNFFAFLGLFFSIGLLIDSQTYIFKLLDPNTVESLTYLTEEDVTTGRCAFLADEVSTFGIYLSFCCASSAYLLCNTKGKLKQWYYILCVLMPILGSWYSGSRQIFFIVLLIAFFSMIYYAFCIKGNKGQIVVLSLFLFCAMSYYIVPMIAKNDKIAERYTGDSDGGNSMRIRQWESGSKYFIDHPMALLIGNGIGSVTTKDIRPGEKVYSHYESTFLSKMLDIGFSGLLFVLFPVFLILKYIRQRNDRDLFDFLMLIIVFNYLFTSFISPNGSHPSTQYIMFLIIGIYIVREKFVLYK